MTAGQEQQPDSPAGSRQQLIKDVAWGFRVHQTAYDRFEDAAAAYVGVNRTAMRCMDLLDQSGQLTAGEIAVATGLSSGAVTAMLDRLERDGLVQRSSDPSDRRRVLVTLTGHARQVAAEIYGPIASEISRFERYTDAELNLIIEVMRTATEALGRHAARVEKQARPKP